MKSPFFASCFLMGETQTAPVNPADDHEGRFDRDTQRRAFQRKSVSGPAASETEAQPASNVTD